MVNSSMKAKKRSWLNVVGMLLVMTLFTTAAVFADETPSSQLPAAGDMTAAADANLDGNAISFVKLITEREIEIGVRAPVTGTLTDAIVKAAFVVEVGGQSVDYEYLSYFDFGEKYGTAPVINIRLNNALKVRSRENEEYDLGEGAAASLNISMTSMPNDKREAVWEPFYTFYNDLNAVGSGGERGNRGSRGRMWVWGNEDSFCTEASTAHVPTTPTDYQANYRNPAWVVATYVTAAIDRTVGRSEYLVQAANDSGMRVVIVGNGNSVYTVPEYRHLYNPADRDTRVTIGGSREIPIIVTTAEDVCRVKGANESAFSDTTFEMIREFSRLFLELGVKDGWSMFPLGIYDAPDSYNSLKRLESNLQKSKNLWPGTNMTKSLEDYFVLGTMVYFECLPESSTWQAEAFPINTRRELLEYDLALYESMVEVYGEWEYFVGGGTGRTDFSRRWAAPWYKHNQVDNYTVTGGQINPYDPLKIDEVNLISSSQVELVFNREIKDLDELREISNWELEWTPSANAGEYIAGQTYTFNADSASPLVMEYYMWKTLTLKVVNQKFNLGYVNYEIGGFTQEEIDRGFDNSLSIEEGYKPWFSEDAYYRDLTPYRVNFMGDLGDISGWMADTNDAAERVSMSVSPKVLATLTDEEIAEKHLVEAKQIPRTDFVGRASALQKGEYIRFDADKGGYVAYDKSNNPLDGGNIRFSSSLNGSMNVTFLGSPAVTDWAGNELEAKSYPVRLNPWQKQIMRSEKTGIYVYADETTLKNSLLVACDYWDYIFSGTYNNYGQRMADGFNFFFHHRNAKTGEYGSAGLEILGYNTHMYMTPIRRSLYNAGPTVLYAEGLGYGVCSTTEYALLRDYQYTRYKHESIMHHEGAHSVEFPGMFYFTDLNYAVHELWNDIRADHLWDSAYPAQNSAEWFGTLSTQWFGTQRESTDGSVTGVWTALNTREEIYVYDPRSYEFMKKVYYNGETYLDPAKVPSGDTWLPGWDSEGNSINDDIIKWGLSFPGTMNEDRSDWGITNQFKWTSWGAPNEWDVHMDTAANSGIRYGSGVPNPGYPGRESYTRNYNPYLLEYSYNDGNNGGGSSGGCDAGMGLIGMLLLITALAFMKNRR